MLLRSGLLRGRGPVDVLIHGETIAAVEPAGSIAEPEGAVVHELGGSVIVPGFVEPHLHLDKAHLGASAGGLAEAIAATARRKAGFTRDDVRARAARTLAAAVAHGTTAVRAQTEVDPGVGLLGIDVMTELAEDLVGVVELQTAVFPQEGILSRPGTLPLMREALSRAGTIVGGCPYSEVDVADARAHVDLVLDLAVEYGVPADLHLDLADDTSDGRFALAEHVARATVARGLQGRVSIGHATTLASLHGATRGRVLAALAEARITVVLLPATDLFLVGRADEANVRRGVAPLRALWEEGVPTALSSNNIRNAFTPSGTADPLDMALLLGRVSHLSADADFDRLLEMITVAGRQVIDPGSVGGIRTGARADVVVLDQTLDVPPVIEQPSRRLVISRGSVVSAETRDRTLAPALERLAALAPASV
ncbi:amidohydrolase family protein [Microbacterium sp. ZW T5_45]|uniref:amidohydrolase family protein n=1 Tax=Microbacterium sp. ZW T5_45 TaxID=3378080 RepID=UPI0038532620